MDKQKQFQRFYQFNGHICTPDLIVTLYVIETNVA